MSEILSCPFCGGEAFKNTVRYDRHDDIVQLNGQSVFHGVNCVLCGVNNVGLVGYRTEAEAIIAWNTRATPRPDSAASELAVAHDARVTELLHANNREVERRRAAENAMALPQPTPQAPMEPWELEATSYLRSITSPPPAREPK